MGKIPSGNFQKFFQKSESGGKSGFRIFRKFFQKLELYYYPIYPYPYKKNNIMKKLLLIMFMVFSLNTVFAQAEAFIGEVRIWTGNFAPKGWAFCEGQSISIQQNAALFSIIGTQYGGNGQTTFNLPDLRARVPVGVNQSQPNYPNIQQGQAYGNPTVTLSPVNLPFNMSVPVTVPKPAEGVQTQSITPMTNGANYPLSLYQPSLGFRYIICLYGLYPSRD